MRLTERVTWFVGSAALLCVLGAYGANAQEKAQERPPERSFFSAPGRDRPAAAPAPAPVALNCRGPIKTVIDVADENVRTTTAVYGSSPGGGEGAQFDKTPVLSTRVSLAKGDCLNAHLSAMVGSKQTYGNSSLTLFQVTVTGIAPVTPPRHMVGHYETPYGVTPSSPAVALEAERDVDMLSANFFQRVGNGPHEVAPGTYLVDVWWAGAPPVAGPGGAIGAAFVLKLYMR